MPAGNFVSAALPSIRTHIKNAIRDTDSKYINNQSVNAFLKDTSDKFLTSIGVAVNKLPNPENTKGKFLNWKEERKNIVKKGRITPKLVQKYLKHHLGKFQQIEFLKDVEFIVDSGGYSIQQKDYFEYSEIPQFIDLYHQEFLMKHDDKFNYAFSLDISPGATHCPFNMFQMKDLAYQSYEQLSGLPEHIRKKILYVHHFRTPLVRDLYVDLLNRYGDNFYNFATGGLVSFGRTNKTPPYILYIVPLLDILKMCLRRGIKKFRFHVLGGSEWKEILGHVFLARHIKELFDIEVQITFDSSTIFRTLCMGRYTFVADPVNKSIKRISLRGDDLKLRYTGDPTKSRKEIVVDLFNEAVQPYGMSGLTYDEYLYEDTGFHSIKESTKESMGYGVEDLDEEDRLLKTGSLSDVVYAYGIMQILYTFKKVERWCNEIVDDFYSSYIGKDLSIKKDLLCEKIEPVMIMLNGGKSIGKSIDIRTISIPNSLQMLNDFKSKPEKTIELCTKIIKTYMSGDECKELYADSTISFADY